jgi:hypothetical protein
MPSAVAKTRPAYLQPDGTRWTLIQNPALEAKNVFHAMGATDTYAFNDVSAKPGTDPAYMVYIKYCDRGPGWYYATLATGPEFGRVAYIRTNAKPYDGRGCDAAIAYQREAIDYRIHKAKAILSGLNALAEALA